MRRLMVWQSPANNQRIIALFLSLGHYDSLNHRLSRTYRARWRLMGESLAEYLPDSLHVPSFGGTSYWVKSPESLDTQELYRQAASQGILFEPSDVFFVGRTAPRNYIRLGFSSIPTDRIEPGVRTLARPSPDIAPRVSDDGEKIGRLRAAPEQKP